MKAWVLAVVLIAMCGGVALGHARYVKSDPAKGAVLNRSPQAVRAWFSEELNPNGSVMNVRDARDRVVASGGVDLDDLERKSMIVRVRALAPGKYTVGWRTVSAEDGDVLHDRFSFMIAAPK